MLICEMAAYYRRQGKSLVQVINELYDRYGYYQNTTLSYSFEGAEGMEIMAERCPLCGSIPSGRSPA